jgi:hypothetical protein
MRLPRYPRNDQMESEAQYDPRALAERAKQIYLLNSEL